MDEITDQNSDALNSLLIEGRFLPTTPFDLTQSLKIRDGVKKSKTPPVSRKTRQEFNIPSLKIADICPN